MSKSEILYKFVKRARNVYKDAVVLLSYLENPLERPGHFEYLYRLIQSLPHWKFSISTQNAGILKYSSETVSRSSPSTSASFAKNRALRGCGSFFRLSTFCAAPFPDVSARSMKDTIISEIVFYKRFLLKMLSRCK